MKLMQRPAVEPLARQCRTGADLFDTELILRAERAGLVVAELPVTVRELRPSRTPILRRARAHGVRARAPPGDPVPRVANPLTRADVGRFSLARVASPSRQEGVCMGTTEIEQRGIDVIRGLAMDAVQKAGNGHPGTAMALAPLAHVLWTRIMRYDAARARLARS